MRGRRREKEWVVKESGEKGRDGRDQLTGGKLEEGIGSEWKTKKKKKKKIRRSSR